MLSNLKHAVKNIQTNTSFVLIKKSVENLLEKLRPSKEIQKKNSDFFEDFLGIFFWIFF